MSETTARDNENKSPGPSASGDLGAGPESGEPEKRMTQRKSQALRLVERATALRGLSISRPPEAKCVLRRLTTIDIYGKDPEIPYVKFEAAVRDLVCSLMERQDRMNEAIFNRINDIGYRIEDLEEDRAASGRSR
ncbi:MAG: hypothetical protein METHP_01851 [Methanoregula sp. SKADARSKE-2]|nr:MAG: hypothetical protein METHP_01851 [Methanoregula sp. SKADARSKE-2]